MSHDPLHRDDPGRVMAVDLGEKRIGIALSDPTRMLARSHAVLPRRARADDFARYNALIAEHDVRLIVFGLPRYLDGSDSTMTAWVRDYAADCARHVPVPVVLWDETLSSRTAHALLKEQGLNRRRRHARIDAAAAAVFLQSYLDAQDSAESTPPPAPDSRNQP